MPSASAHACRLAAACWHQCMLCAGLMPPSASLRESRPARSAFLASIHESRPPRIAPLARTAAVVRDRRCRAFAASDEQRSRERRNLPLARHFCQSVARPELRFERLARRNRHAQVNPRIPTALHGGSVSHRCCLVARSLVALGDSNGQSHPTRPQHPTACRTLARRFRASFQRDAARRAVGT